MIPERGQSVIATNLGNTLKKESFFVGFLGTCCPCPDTQDWSLNATVGGCGGGEDHSSPRRSRYFDGERLPDLSHLPPVALLALPNLVHFAYCILTLIPGLYLIPVIGYSYVWVQQGTLCDQPQQPRISGSSRTRQPVPYVKRLRTQRMSSYVPPGACWRRSGMLQNGLHSTHGEKGVNWNGDPHRNEQQAFANRTVATSSEACTI